ncbi:hypothetical protein [Kribbella speibonae]|uniref:Uncharacterized protein n=1 Tax=Kribbella speibonae TaxID=1572660 RepID=A0A4R0J4B2_9ACTN|nr:hypothetical protein [Kribbella speibonae]TCC40567.1 hypothetical protein E0H92_02375 [Kribbella speibonae]
MHHDDTLSRLQHLSKPKPDVASPQSADTRTARPPDNQADLPAEERLGHNASAVEEPSTEPSKDRADRSTPGDGASDASTDNRDHSSAASDKGRPNTAETIREIHDTLGARHPDVADVVERLVEDRKHPLDLVAALNDRERRPAVLLTVRELADESLLGTRTLDEYRADNPGRGPLFSSAPQDVNQNDEGRSRKSLYVAQCKSLDAAREVGVSPSADERVLVDDYGRRLATEVLPAVRLELLRSAEAAGGDLSTRAKTSAGLHDKVARMSDGGDGRPGRTGYQVGDVIDAVGARIVVPDTDALELTMADIQERFGTGDDGRILEIENLYHEPKAHNPSYRVVPCIVAIEVDRLPYTFELQLCTRRASIASDLEHNTVYKPYINPTAAEQDKMRRMQAEAAALDQDETRSRWHA